MRLILARHGETDYNRKGISQCSDKPRLTELGIRQADGLAEYAAKQGVDVIFCSPSRRTRQTLERVLKRVAASVVLEPLIREREAGVWIGKSIDEFKAHREALGLAKHEFRPEGGENYADVRERARLFWEKIHPMYAGRTVMLISHSTFNNILAGLLLRLSLRESDMGPQDNCSVHELVIEEGKAKTARINHRHLLDQAPDEE